MSLVSVTGAHLAFGHVALLDSVDLSIEPGERVALIGRNGSGKSSLMRAIAGETALDDGQIIRQSGATMGYVAQEPALEAAHSVFEAVAAGVSQDAQLIADYERLVAAMSHSEPNAEQLDQLSRLQNAMDASGAWAMAHRIERVLSKLSLEGEPLVGTLSGGTRKRVALARALVREPDLLLLDEPTNHLDIDSIAWLEDLLVGMRTAVLVITHDRRFLDRVATRIVELDRGRMRNYPGSFATYHQRKADELEQEQTLEAKFDKFLAQEEVWIRKGVEARRTRDEGRVRRLQALREQRAARRDRLGRVTLAVDAGERSGKLVSELIDVSKSFGTKKVVENFSTVLQRGDRVGLIGPNGAGKTTLIKLILGELPPDAGVVRLGTNRQVAYFDQLREQLDEDATLAETISPGSEWVEIGQQRTHVMSYLGRFLFAPERARSPVRTLSGGERNRLLLARLFARPANLLVLDEPTNDLDIDTLELLEELLDEYPGTVLVVSHDRTFLDNVVTQTIASMGAGRWQEYAGGYEDFELSRSRSRAAQAASTQAAGAKSAPAPQLASAQETQAVEGRPRADGASAPRQAPAAGASANPAQRTGRARLSYKDQRELEVLPARIAALEAEQKALTLTLADPGTYQSAEPARLKNLNDRAQVIEEELMHCLERWEALDGG